MTQLPKSLDPGFHFGVEIFWDLAGMQVKADFAGDIQRVSHQNSRAEGEIVADLMKEAGLAVGGFYKHFKSRDALVIEAIVSALEIWKDRIDPAAAGGTDRAIRRFPLCSTREGCDIPKRASALASFGRHSNSRERALEEVRHAFKVGSWIEFALGFRSGERQHESLTLRPRRIA
jgi:TetR/AcrR family transcriptional regulator, transcriptional repressor for nem operon